jgi:endonuclease YncB( thermonuclease family)
MRLSLAFAIFICLFSTIALADEVAVMDKVVSGDELTLRDGRTLRLFGTKAALPEARAFLESAVSGRALVLQGPTTDRYGRVTALATAEGDSQSVEETLLREGLAFVYPDAGDTRLQTLYVAERAARVGKRGFWAENRDVSPKEAARFCGRYGFVTGSVSKAERVKNEAVLSFGDPDTPEFTVTIPAHDLAAFKKEGIDPLSLQGERIRVRGWIVKDKPPTMAVTDFYQMELVK